MKRFVLILVIAVSLFSLPSEIQTAMAGVGMGFDGHSRTKEESAEPI